MGYAEDIKGMITMPEVARMYGLQVDRAGFAKCPFHSEKTGSFKVYKGQGGYHCFGCGESGDVIDFVQKYFNLSFREALSKLNDDFHLGLPIGETRTPRQRMEDAKKMFQARQVKEAKEKAVECAKSAYNKAFTRWLMISTIVEKLRPEIEDFPGDGWWAAAVTLLPQAEWELEIAENALYEAEHSRYN